MTEKMRVVWGISGAGDRIEDILEIMKKISVENNDVEIRAYLSRAGEQVMKFYRIYNDLRSSFEKVYVERNSNSPFLASLDSAESSSALAIMSSIID